MTPEIPSPGDLLVLVDALPVFRWPQYFVTVEEARNALAGYFRRGELARCVREKGVFRCLEAAWRPLRGWALDAIVAKNVMVVPFAWSRIDP